VTHPVLVGITFVCMCVLRARIHNPVCDCLCIVVPRILQSESEALSSDDSVVLNLPALLDVRLAEAVQLRYSGSAAG
jgi:hypothetical protein